MRIATVTVPERMLSLAIGGGLAATQAEVAVKWPDGTVTNVTDQARFTAPDDSNASDRTVMTAPTPAPLAPNETVDIEIEWHAKVPRPFARTGYIDDYYGYNIANGLADVRDTTPQRQHGTWTSGIPPPCTGSASSFSTSIGW